MKGNLVKLLTIVFFAQANLAVVLSQPLYFNKTYDYDGGAGTGHSVLIDTESYIVTGSGWVTEFGGWNGIYFLIADLKGDIIEYKSYGEEGYAYYSGLSASTVSTKDGGYALGGSVDDTLDNDNALLVKFNSNGDTIFTKDYGGNGFDVAYQSRQIADGSYILLGYTESFGAGSGDIYLIKTDNNGNKLWDTTYGGSAKDLGLSLDLTNDNGFIIGGATDSYGLGATDAYVIKTDSLGKVQWQKTYGTSLDDCGGSVRLTSNGGYILQSCIDTIIKVGDYQYVPYIAKLDSQGKVEWRTFFNNPESKSIWTAKEVINGNFLVVGSVTDAQANKPLGWIAKVNSGGDILWERRHYTRKDIDNYFHDFQPTSDGGYVVTGTAFDQNNKQSIWLVKLDSLGNTCKYGTEGCDSPSTSINEKWVTNNQHWVKVYPNPASNYVMV